MSGCERKQEHWRYRQFRLMRDGQWALVRTCCLTDAELAEQVRRAEGDIERQRQIGALGSEGPSMALADLKAEQKRRGA